MSDIEELFEPHNSAELSDFRESEYRSRMEGGAEEQVVILELLRTYLYHRNVFIDTLCDEKRDPAIKLRQINHNSAGSQFHREAYGSLRDLYFNEINWFYTKPDKEGFLSHIHHFARVKSFRDISFIVSDYVNEDYVNIITLYNGIIDRMFHLEGLETQQTTSQTQKLVLSRMIASIPILSLQVSLSYILEYKSRTIQPKMDTIPDRFIRSEYSRIYSLQILETLRTLCSNNEAIIKQSTDINTDYLLYMQKGRYNPGK